MTRSQRKTPTRQRCSAKYRRTPPPPCAFQRESGMTAARGYAPINTAIWRLTQPVICYPNCYYRAPSTWLISWERWCAAKGHSLQSHRVVKPCQSSSQKSKALKNFQRLLTFQLQAWISLEKGLSGSGERFWCFLWFSVYVQANLLCWPPPHTVNTTRQYFICKVHLIAFTCRGIKKTLRKYQRFLYLQIPRCGEEPFQGDWCFQTCIIHALIPQH